MKAAAYFIFVLSVFAAIFVILKFTDLGRPGYIGEYGDRARQLGYYKTQVNELGRCFEDYRNKYGKYPDDIRKIDPEYMSVTEILNDGETKPVDLKEHYLDRNIRYLLISDSEFLIECKILPKCELRYSSLDKIIKETGDCGTLMNQDSVRRYGE